jgi:hypothetical protein
MPDQSGRIALVTGANSGLGYETSHVLAAKNARLILACRDLGRGEQACRQILAESPNAEMHPMQLDLASLRSVRLFAEAFHERFDRLDLLINNGGVMAVPRAETEDGFEMQFGVNHLGHFALTGLLLDLITRTPKSRVVTITSFGAYFGWMNFEDLHGKRSYRRYVAYCQSKLANVLFACELGRRLDAAGTVTLSLSANPGLAETNLQRTTIQSSGSALERMIYPPLLNLFSHTPAEASLIQLYAAAAPNIRQGGIIGPRFFVRGSPVMVRLPFQARNEEASRRLWEASEQQTGVNYL